MSNVFNFYTMQDQNIVLLYALIWWDNEFEEICKNEQIDH